MSLSLEYGDTVLEGVITLSKKEGWAVLDVTLLKPETYATVGTLYAEKYRSSSDKNLLTETLEPTCYAIKESEKLLIKIYEGRKHREKFAHVYAVYNELTGKN